MDLELPSETHLEAPRNLEPSQVPTNIVNNEVWEREELAQQKEMPLEQQ